MRVLLVSVVVVTQTQNDGPARPPAFFSDVRRRLLMTPHEDTDHFSCKQAS